MQMLLGASRGCLKGTFFDILTINELRVLTAKKGQAVDKVEEDPSKLSKRYLIVTQLNEQKQKVHYPLPLNPIEI